ncbi:hypothetical protein GF371_00800 [Candidatus Woesearchaeota archaeon]|nr:hypothetical protein [Candidatus Woesearchaeota archaeon]
MARAKSYGDWYRTVYSNPNLISRVAIATNTIHYDELGNPLKSKGDIDINVLLDSIPKEIIEAKFKASSSKIKAQFLLDEQIIKNTYKIKAGNYYTFYKEGNTIKISKETNKIINVGQQFRDAKPLKVSRVLFPVNSNDFIEKWNIFEQELKNNNIKPERLFSSYRADKKGNFRLGAHNEPVMDLFNKNGKYYIRYPNKPNPYMQRAMTESKIPISAEDYPAVGKAAGAAGILYLLLKAQEGILMHDSKVALDNSRDSVFKMCGMYPEDARLYYETAAKDLYDKYKKCKTEWDNNVFLEDCDDQLIGSELEVFFWNFLTDKCAAAEANDLVLLSGTNMYKLYEFYLEMPLHKKCSQSFFYDLLLDRGKSVNKKIVPDVECKEYFIDAHLYIKYLNIGYHRKKLHAETDIKDADLVMISPDYNGAQLIKEACKKEYYPLWRGRMQNKEWIDNAYCVDNLENYLKGMHSILIKPETEEPFNVQINVQLVPASVPEIDCYNSNIHTADECSYIFEENSLFTEPYFSTTDYRIESGSVLAYTEVPSNVDINTILFDISGVKDSNEEYPQSPSIYVGEDNDVDYQVYGELREDRVVQKELKLIEQGPNYNVYTTIAPKEIKIIKSDLILNNISKVKVYIEDDPVYEGNVENEESINLTAEIKDYILDCNSSDGLCTIPLKIETIDIEDLDMIFELHYIPYDVALQKKVQEIIDECNSDSCEVLIKISASNINVTDLKYRYKYKNTQPILEPISNISVTEKEEIVLNPVATDADGNNLLFIFPEPFDENGKWKTTRGDSGNYTIEIRVSDGLLSDSKNVNIEVKPLSLHAPDLQHIPDITVKEGDLVTIIANATDPDNDDLIYSINDSRFTQNGNIFRWQTKEGDSGCNAVNREEIILHVHSAPNTNNVDTGFTLVEPLPSHKNYRESNSSDFGQASSAKPKSNYIGIQSFTQSTCNSASGYSWCYEGVYRDDSSYCEAEYKIHGKFIDQQSRVCNIDGQQETCFIGDQATTRVSYEEADDLFIVRDFDTWDECLKTHIECNAYGCAWDSHVREISPGTVVLETAPAKIRNYAFVAYDNDPCYTGYDVWVYGAAGYTGKWNGQYEYYIVRCLEDSDCGIGKQCDRSGNWQNWRCVNDPCASVTCNDYCDGYTKYYSGQCNNGQCAYQIEQNSVDCGYDPCLSKTCDDICHSFTRYYNGRCIDGQCHYNFEFNSSICGFDPCSDVTCNDYCDGYTRYYNGQCSNGQCNFDLEYNSSECGYVENCSRTINVRISVTDGKETIYQDISITILSINSSIETETCSPNWVLNDTWSECEDNIKTCNYYDENNCNTTEGKPDDMRERCYVYATRSTSATNNPEIKLWFKHCVISDAPVGGGYAGNSTIAFDINDDDRLDSLIMDSIAAGFPEQELAHTTPEGYKIKRLQIDNNWNNLAIEADGYNYLYSMGGGCAGSIEGDNSTEVCVNLQDEVIACPT